MELIAQVPSLKKPPEFGANIDMLALRVIAADWLNLLSAHSFLQRKINSSQRKSFELVSEVIHYLKDFNLSVDDFHELEARLKQKKQYLMKENIKGVFDSESLVAPILTNIQNTTNILE